MQPQTELTTAENLFLAIDLKAQRARIINAENTPVNGLRPGSELHHSPLPEMTVLPLLPQRGKTMRLMQLKIAFELSIETGNELVTVNLATKNLAHGCPRLADNFAPRRNAHIDVHADTDHHMTDISRITGKFQEDAGDLATADQ